MAQLTAGNELVCVSRETPSGTAASLTVQTSGVRWRCTQLGFADPSVTSIGLDRSALWRRWRPATAGWLS